MVKWSMSGLIRIREDLTVVCKSGNVRLVADSTTGILLFADSTALAFLFLAVGGILNVHDFSRALQLLQGSPLISIVHKCLCLRPA